MMKRFLTICTVMIVALALFLPCAIGEEAAPNEMSEGSSEPIYSSEQAEESNGGSSDDGMENIDDSEVIEDAQIPSEDAPILDEGISSVDEASASDSAEICEDTQLHAEETEISNEKSSEAVPASTIELCAPAHIRVEQVTLTQASIQWDASEYAQYYELYRSTNGGAWQKVKNVTGNSTYNYSLIGGATYQYKLRACAEAQGSVYKSEYSEAAGITILGAPEQPKMFTVVQSGLAKADLQWEAAENAQYYELYRSTNGGAWQKVKNVSGNITYNYSLLSGSTYQYKLRACIDFQECGYKSGYSEAVEITIAGILEQPKNLAVTQSGMSKVDIRWDASKDAQYYELYCRVDDGTWQKVKNVTENFTYNYSLVEGVAYQYKVRACGELGGWLYTSSFFRQRGDRTVS